MEWMLPVLALTLVWWWLRKNRPPPPEPKPLPDARALLAEELARRSEAARQEGRYPEAQAFALKSAWLSVHPKLGDDDPPQNLDPNEGRHLSFVGTVWARYREARPAGQEPVEIGPWLPYPKAAIEQALRFLLDIGEGTITSPHVGPGQATPEVLQDLRKALRELAD